MTKQILKLLANNRKRGFCRAETADDATTIFIYDMIVSNDEEAKYFGGVSAEGFVKQLRAIKSSVIHIRINSPGGDVFGARAMEQAIRESDAKIVVHIDGYAASAASFLAMAADEINIARGAFVMIHKAWTIALGNSDDLLSTASLLEKIDDTLVETYADRTGQDREKIKEWMAAETWFSGNEAVEAGFADNLSVEGKPKDALSWDMSAYEHPPATEVFQEQPSNSNIDNMRRKLRLVEQAA